MTRALLLLCAFALAAHAQEAEPQAPKGPAVGAAAPVFEGTDDQGKPWRSSEHVGEGKVLVVYFYPADMTGGCTAQACAYRDAAASLKAEGITVVGVSGDTVENHQVFKKAHSLSFTLLADPEGKLAQAFGVPTGPGGKFKAKLEGGEATLERGVTARRWTFVIGPDGKLLHRDERASPTLDALHVRLVAARALKKLQEGTPPELSKRLAETIDLLQRGETKAFLERCIPPQKLATVLARGKRTVEQLAEQMKPRAAQGAAQLAGCKDKAAEVLPSGDAAVFELGPGRQVWFEKVDGVWYLGD
ncbi:MAG: peroxiredoxin [Planctomycetota bacterium]